MAETVWMVTSGSYSDYSVDGIFSTEEKAKAWVERHTTRYMDPSYDIEEVVLDTGVEGDIRYEMRYSTIDYAKPALIIETSEHDSEWSPARLADHAYLYERDFSDAHLVIEFPITTDHPEKARKIGTEKWGQFMAGQMTLPVMSSLFSVCGEVTVAGDVARVTMKDGETRDFPLIPEKRTWMSVLERTDTPFMDMVRASTSNWRWGQEESDDL